MKITFHGAAGEVTGSNFLLESGGEKILIDCGLKQGGNFAEDFNFKPFPYNPKDIRAVFITHAHIDHTGRLPKLIGEGFNGTVYSTPPTKDFSEHLLRDSIDILSREAKRCDADSFCNPKNIGKLMKRWETMGYRETITQGPFTVTFYNSGHILGSAFIKIEAEGKSIVFSGGLGNVPAPLLKSREDLNVAGQVDFCVMESTYGNRVHESQEEAIKKLDEMIESIVDNKGTLMIPAFALERTQAILFHIHRLMDNKKIPRVPIYLDSPLAIRLTDVYSKYKDWLNMETKEFREMDHKLFKFPELTRTLSTEESKTINNAPSPKVIVAGSGMSNGGRILHHEIRYLPGSQNGILFVGYQAKGTLGRKILDGSKTGKPFSVNIFEERVDVNCAVQAIGGYSAHADKPQAMEWLSSAQKDMKKLFLVHGERDQSEALGNDIEKELSIDSHVPKRGETVDL